MSTLTPELHKKCVDTIRFLAVDGVEKANSGHPGMPMGAAAMAFVLWSRFLKYDPRAPRWANRDRFVLSAGHGSMLIYSLLHLAGFDVTMEDLKQFRQLHSRTPGHPEFGETPGLGWIAGDVARLRPGGGRNKESRAGRIVIAAKKAMNMPVPAISPNSETPR